MPLLAIGFGAAFTLLAAYALGTILLRKLPAPPEIALGVGAVALSLLIFLLLLANLGYWYIYLALGALAIGFAAKAASRGPRSAAAFAAGPGKGAVPIAAILLLAPYSLWYFVNALAPEILPDGITYHLGLPYEYTRLAGFPDRITFYDVVPQGMEMLYTMAFAFGKHSAAKLVEFAFFAATLPLIFRIGTRLQLSRAGSVLVAAIYFCAPVAGATGSSSYNDAAGVFFTLATFYLLLVWYDSGDDRYLLPAGALAGFCYAIKVPGVMTIAAALLFVALTPNRDPDRVPSGSYGSFDVRVFRRKGALLRLAATAALVMAPWLIRNAVLTGNPVAPLLNSVFPNPYFHIATERELTSNLRSFGPIKPQTIPWELAFGDHLDGTFGPLLFALPLGLLALRRREGRWCWAAALLLALPWLSNTGARFLMPAVVAAGFTLAMVLPRRVAWAAVILQAVLCWPWVISLWETRYAFRLHDFPLRAALRLEPEKDYLSRHSDDFKLAKIIETRTPPSAKILGLITVANAYLARDVRVSWQSAEADRLLDTLRLASLYTEPLFDWKLSWPAESLERLRFRLPVSSNFECDIVDVRVYAGEDLVFTSPHWDLRAWPNSWEAPLALDGNLATRWRTWQPIRAGMYMELRFDHPQRISSAVLYSHAPLLGVPIEIYGQAGRGPWRLLGKPQAIQHPKEDLRPDAVLAVRRAGYRYLIAATGSGGTTPLGNALVGHEPEWGLERVAEAGRYFLFRVK